MGVSNEIKYVQAELTNFTFLQQQSNHAHREALQ